MLRLPSWRRLGAPACLAALVVAGALVPAFGQKVTREAKNAELPLDSTKYFSPETPLCEILEVRLFPKSDSFEFGREPEFSISIKNVGKHPVHLGGDLVEATQFNPFMIVGVVSEDGREWTYRHDWMVPEKHRLLHPGKILRFSYPLVKAKPEEGKYGHRPDAYLPGTYYIYANFWVLKDGLNKRAISPAAKFTVTGGDEADAKIAREIQLGGDLPKGFSFELEKVGKSEVKVWAVNKTKEDVYLGNHWGWWRKYPGKVATEQKTGVRPTQRIRVPAGTKRALQTTQIGSGDLKGTYQIQFRYYNGAGRLLEKSNVLKSSL